MQLLKGTRVTLTPCLICCSPAPSGRGSQVHSAHIFCAGSLGATRGLCCSAETGAQRVLAESLWGLELGNWGISKHNGQFLATLQVKATDLPVRSVQKHLLISLFAALVCC